MSRLHGWRPKGKFTCGLEVSQDEWDRIFGVSEREYERVGKLMAEPPQGWERCEPTKDNSFGERPSQEVEQEKYYLHSPNFGKKLSGTSQEGATPSTEAGGSNPQRSDADGVTVNGEPAAQFQKQ
jgi:hypothetical protein